MDTGKVIERVNYIDYIRAIGIILMVLAHIPLSDSFVHYVHGFHMPLFFVVSGYCYKAGGGYGAFKENPEETAYSIFFIFRSGVCIMAH